MHNDEQRLCPEEKEAPVTELEKIYKRLEALTNDIRGIDRRLELFLERVEGKTTDVEEERGEGDVVAPPFLTKTHNILNALDGKAENILNNINLLEEIY